MHLAGLQQIRQDLPPDPTSQRSLSFNREVIERVQAEATAEDDPNPPLVATPPKHRIRRHRQTPRVAMGVLPEPPAGCHKRRTSEQGSLNSTSEVGETSRASVCSTRPVEPSAALEPLEQPREIVRVRVPVQRAYTASIRAKLKDSHPEKTRDRFHRLPQTARPPSQDEFSDVFSNREKFRCHGARTVRVHNRTLPNMGRSILVTGRDVGRNVFTPKKL